MGGDARAYPVEVMGVHELGNDTVGGRPITFKGSPYVVVYDPRDRASFAFLRRVDRQTLSFDAANSEGEDLRMRDRETGTLWDRMRGEAVAGPLAGRQLHPAIAVPWLVDRWRDIYGAGASLYGESELLH